MNYLEKAKEYKDEIISNRRHIHQNPEIGFELDKTTSYVIEKLESYGIEAKKIGRAGVTATIGQGSPVFMLRADMDALAMKEETGLDFSSQNPGACHSCGHDGHTSMLLGAARLLKENEENLQGTVKLMFQPAEEILTGAKDMIDAGILENPKVDAAMAMHIFAGGEDSHAGQITMARGQAMTSADAVDIHIHGHQAHGSTPEEGVDAVVVAAYMIIAIQSIISREVSMFDNCLIGVGTVQGGDTVNTVGGYAKLEVSMRTTSEEKRAYLLKRLKEVVEGVALTHRAKVEVDHLYGAPSLFNNEDLVDQIIDCAKDIVGQNMVAISPPLAGTEDFAYISNQVPAVMVYLGGGSVEEGYEYGLHSPSMVFNEDILPIGASLYAHVATEYLKNN